VKQLGFAVGLVTVLAVGPSALVWPSTALAQGLIRDQSGTLAATPEGDTKAWLSQRFEGSSAELDNYVGSGTFYRNRYHNPYVTSGLYLRPLFHVGGRHDLVLSARLYFEAEYTQPDNPQARRFYPADTWLTASERNLYTEPRSRIRFGVSGRVVVPTSYESQYAHLLFGFGGGGSASREFQFGRPDAKGKRWGLGLVVASIFTKNLHSNVLRGNGPGDSTGCLAPQSTLTSAGSSEPSGAASDRCGGPLNTNFAFLSSIGATVSRSPWSLSATLILVNSVRYAVPVDAFAASDVPRGRDDSTWGLIALSYEVTPHLGLGVGVSSFQPALDSRYRYPRFPFFDLSGGANQNNFTQLFASVNGTL
jgi:hypothetical protein